MSYKVLYRAYRPKKFSEVIGQEYIVKTLVNSIKNNKIAHAYLFAGPRGTGKTTVAKLFAKAINCDNFTNESCDICQSCEAHNNSKHPDIVEMDAASNNGVDDIRNIVDEISYAPLIGKYKVYIIDEVHMLTPSAFNALLKSLEEPPAHIVFILATTDPQKIIPTVLSRCQRYNFSKISIYDIKKRMIEILNNNNNIKYEEEALLEIAKLADGGMRDALSILEQVLSYNVDGVFIKDVEKIYGLSTLEEKINILMNIHSDNVNEVIKNIRNMYMSGIDLKRLCVDLLEIIKEVLIYSERSEDVLLTVIKEIDAQKLLNITGIDVLLSDIKHIENLVLNSSRTANFLTYFEITILEMSNIKAHLKIGNSQEKKEINKVEEIEKDEVHIKEEVSSVESEDKIVNNDEELKKEKYLNFIANMFAYATKEDKINDTLIYNRLELYRLETEKKKFYELLNETELFASCSDAIFIVAPTVKANTINSEIMNKYLFDFINSEFGINKMIYAFSRDDLTTIVNKFKALTPEQKANRPEIKKYKIIKKQTTEEKLNDMFDNVTIE